MDSGMKKVGIIGAGAAGVCAVKHCLETSGMVPVAWEHSSSIGGTWVYTPCSGNDVHGYPIHSSMYESLRTNLPREIMAFPDYAFTIGDRSFVKHSEVKEYLNDYADHFGVREYIKFEHHVEVIEPLDEDDRGTAWRVQTKNLVDGTICTEICDYIIVCNGHYSIPRLPIIEDMEVYKGKIQHSHNYREPSAYKDLKVAILGASASGLDLAMEVSKVAKEVYLCHNLGAPYPSKMPEKVIQMVGIKSAKEDGFVLLDGSLIEVDAVIFCTGYDYVFPFLAPSTNISVNKDNIVTSLHKDLINTTFPSMALIGIPFLVCPFPFFDIQIRYFLKVCLGEVDLPSREEMENIISKKMMSHKNSGRPAHHYHKLADRQWDYNDMLIEEAGLKPLPKVIKKIDEDIRYHRRLNLTWYKSTNYIIHDKESYSSPFIEGLN